MYGQVVFARLQKLSYRDLVEMMAGKRGLSLAHTTIMR